jgi:hypothetical protein
LVNQEIYQAKNPSSSATRGLYLYITTRHERRDSIYGDCRSPCFLAPKPLSQSLARPMSSSILPVHYDSSDSSEEEATAPTFSRRKLPPLSSALLVPTPIDDPSLHQGRVRNTPFVEGQWAAYAYAPVIIDGGSQLHTILLKLWTASRDQIPSLHPIVPIVVEENDADGQKTKGKARDIELHVSLSRPLYLRAHQRNDLKAVLKNIAQRHHPCVYPTCPPQLSYFESSYNVQILQFLRDCIKSH